MSRITFASHPFLLGFEELDRLVERTARNGASGFPPFNIEQLGPDAWRIVLAVAGFPLESLSITVENSHLIVRGEKQEERIDSAMLHHGITAGAFHRSFVLASCVEVAGAHLDRGLLKVDLIRRTPETTVQTIRIGTSESKED